MPAESSKSSRLLAWLQLMRLPNVFTAMADIFMGYWFMHDKLSLLGGLLPLLLSSSCFYTAGMILNDVFDLEQDRRERPQRPIPSGRISLSEAKTAGWSLFAGGITFGLWAGSANQSANVLELGWAGLAYGMRPIIIAVTLALVVLAYDRFLKRTPLGPIAMGGCRFLNVLLGMSASPEPWSAINYIVAAGIGVYVIGITWFARKEATTSSKVHLLGGFITMLAGMALLWSVPMLPPAVFFLSLNVLSKCWAVLWLGLAALISWRFVRAIAHPQPVLVQRAVKTGILSIIVLDAAVVFGIRGCVPAIAILLLLVPAILLGRWIYST